MADILNCRRVLHCELMDKFITISSQSINTGPEINGKLVTRCSHLHTGKWNRFHWVYNKSQYRICGFYRGHEISVSFNSFWTLLCFVSMFKHKMTISLKLSWRQTSSQLMILGSHDGNSTYQPMTIKDFSRIQYVKCNTHTKHHHTLGYTGVMSKGFHPEPINISNINVSL